MKTTKKPVAKKPCLMGDRKVVIVNNHGKYATQFNVAFGIVMWGEKSAAWVLYSKDTVDVLKDLREKGKHVVWVEQIGECPCGCHKA